MHTGKSYKLPEFLAWTRRTIYVLAVLNAVPVALYQWAGLKWLVVPWGIVLLLGILVALSAGFKQMQAHGRVQEAQQAWASIVGSSRAWAAMCRDYVAEPNRARQLAYRHLAWLTALRHQLRESKAWESMRRAHNAEYRKLYSVPERERTLESELARYIPGREAALVLMSGNRAAQVLSLQGSDMKELLDQGRISAAQSAELQGVVRELAAQQSRNERIKNFPFPRQYAFIHTVSVWILCFLLPLGLIGEFERLDEAVDGWARGNMVWLAIPLGMLVSWIYASLDQIGESSENPFEGGANDVPISHMCEEIETDVREILGEANVPAPSRLESDIAI